MNRAVYLAVIAGCLFRATLACADEGAVPAFFTLVELNPAGAVQSPSMIQQVAAQSDLPAPKIFSVSVNGSEGDRSDANVPPAPMDNEQAPTPARAPSGQDSGGCQSSDGNCDSGSNTCGQGCCSDCCNSCFRPTWVFKAGAVVLDRVSPGSTALVVETGTGRSLMNASGFSFNWNGGVDASLIRRIGDDSQLEVRYFGINNWTALQRFVTTTPADIPVTPPVVIPPTVLPPPPAQAPPNVTARFDTNLYNAEVNWHSHADDTIGWLAGFRWMQVQDALGITTPNATVRSVTDNQLFGGQIGGDFRVWSDCEPLRIDTVIKAGLFGNAASNQFESREQLAFVGEVGVNIIYQCCEHVAISAGYELLWLDGLAVASDQIPHLNFTTQSGLDTGGNAFYHGAMFSLNCSW